jgi:hypothetical protein
MDDIEKGEGVGRPSELARVIFHQYISICCHIYARHLPPIFLFWTVVVPNDRKWVTRTPTLFLKSKSDKKFMRNR